MTTLATGRRRERILPPPITGQEIVLLGVIAGIWLLLALLTPSFGSAGSIQSLLVRLAPVGVMAIGMTLVIVSAGIDISVAASLMVCSVVTAKLLVNTGMPALPAMAVSLALGGLLGAVNGLLIAYGRVHAIIITFGTANIFQFLGLRIFDSQTVNDIPATFAFLGRGEAGRTLGVPHSFVLLLIILLIAWWYIRHVPSGRHFYAIGGDQRSARLAGIPIEGRVMSAYIVTGVLVGLAACMTLAGGTSTLDQNVGAGQELAVIAAVVIGGTSIMGGRGSVVGSVLGALLVQTVRTGVTHMGWPSQLANLFVGLCIVIAVGTDLVRERRSAP